MTISSDQIYNATYGSTRPGIGVVFGAILICVTGMLMISDTARAVALDAKAIDAAQLSESVQQKDALAAQVKRQL